VSATQSKAVHYSLNLLLKSKFTYLHTSEEKLLTLCCDNFVSSVPVLVILSLL